MSTDTRKDRAQRTSPSPGQESSRRRPRVASAATGRDDRGPHPGDRTRGPRIDRRAAGPPGPGSRATYSSAPTVPRWAEARGGFRAVPTTTTLNETRDTGHGTRARREGTIPLALESAARPRYTERSARS